MNGKTKALKALCILAVVIALCMFFARTVQTITTPKIQRITATKGKLEEKIAISAQVYFPKTEDIRIKDARTMNLTVDEVMVRPGYQVKAGDVIFTADVPSFDEKMEEARGKFDDKVAELAEERAGHIRFLVTTKQNDLYNAMMDAYDAYYAKRYEAYSLAAQEGVVLPADIVLWVGLQNTSPELSAAAAEAAAAYAKMDEASTELKRLYNSGERVGDETFNHIKKLDSLRKEIDELQQDMLELELLGKSLTQVTAPHDGYITAIELKAGDSYDGTKAAYSISAEGSEPVLRADVSDITKTLAAGNKVTTSGDKSTEIQEITAEAGGKKYALIEINQDVTKDLGSLSRMLSMEEIPLTITYKASKNTTLLPASAVRLDNDSSYYVYVVNRDYGGGLLGSGGYVLSKQTVTVLEKTDKLVSLADDLQYTEIADREDRAISDGQAVMDYVD